MTNLNEYELSLPLAGESGEFEQENEMVNEMMEVSNEMEFENFLGSIWDTAKRVYKSPQGQAIKKDFITGAKSFGKQMFPSIGKNLGSYFGGSTGAKYGGKVGKAVGDWLLDETSESEAADYVRVISKAANYLNRSLANGGDMQIAPRILVTRAINKAAQPIFSQRRLQQAGSSGSTNYRTQKQGQWIRRGNTLVLQGVS